MTKSLAEAVSAFDVARGSLAESMFISNIAIRYPGGEIEGFSGTSTGGALNAEKIANKKAKKKAKMLGTPDVIILGPKDFAKLTHKDRRKLERDWKNSSRFDESSEMSLRKANTVVLEVAEKLHGKESNEARVVRASLKLLDEAKMVSFAALSGETGLDLEDVGTASDAVEAMDVGWRVEETYGNAVRIWDNGKTGSVRYMIALFDDAQDKWHIFKASELQGPQGVFTLEAEVDMLPSEGFPGQMLNLEQLPQAVQTEVQRRMGEMSQIKDEQVAGQTAMQTEAKKTKDEKPSDNKLDARETKALIEKSLAILANVLAVGLSQIEAQHGHHFESSQDAKKFLLNALGALRTSGQTEIMDAVRRFDRIGGERLVQQYRRELGELL
jgi:hypothetical protein